MTLMRKKLSIKTNPKWTQMLELTTTDIKRVIIVFYMFKKLLRDRGDIFLKILN